MRPNCKPCLCRWLSRAVNPLKLMLNRRTHKTYTQVAHQTRKAQLCNPACFTSCWLIIYGKTALSAQTEKQKRTEKSIWWQLYSGNPPSKAVHTVCSNECVPAARLAVICTVAWQHKTAHPPYPTLSPFNKECLLTMQQFDALFIFLCPLEAENTHLQTHTQKDTKVCHTGPLIW